MQKISQGPDSSPKTSKVLKPALENPLWRRSQARTLPDGQVNGPEPLFPPRKGRLVGKSRTSDFVRGIPRNTLLTKALNHYLELNFCGRRVYQRQSRICGTCRLNKLPIVSTLRSCFSGSPWEGSDRQTWNLASGYTLHPLDINH